jgi:hypothetical protein
MVYLIMLGLVNNEYGRMWKGAVTAYFEVVSQYLNGEAEKNHKKNSVKIPDLRLEI